METRQIHVRDLSTVTGIQQFEHEVQSIYFLGLEDFVGTIYLSMESDEYSNEAVPLTSNTFIIGQPMTLYNTTYTCQIYGVLNDGEKIQLSKRFRLIVYKSNNIQGDSEEYPIDPNFTNGIIEFVNEQKAEIDTYTDAQKSEIEATGEAVIASIQSDYTELNDKVYGKDLVSQEMIEAGYLNANGTEASTFSNGVIKTIFIPIEPNTDYTFMAWVAITNNQFWYRNCWYDESKVFISQYSNQYSDITSDEYTYKRTVKSPSNAKYIRLSMRSYLDGVFSLYKGNISWESVERPIRYTTDIVPHVTDKFNVKSIAHAGYTPDDGGAPEDTLIAFIEAKRHGFDMVECDLTFTKDGVCVLLHDRTINRTGRNADGSTISSTINIRDITYEQALQYDFGVWKGEKYKGTKIPTLDEFLSLCRELHLYPYIEVKFNDNWTRADVEGVIDKIKDYGMLEKSTILSFSYEMLSWAKTYCPTIRLCYVVDLGITWSTTLHEADVFKSGKNQVVISCRKETVNPEHSSYKTGYQEAPNRGIGLECWTVYTNPEIWFEKCDKLIKGFTTAQYRYDEYMGEKNSALTTDTVRFTYGDPSTADMDFASAVAMHLSGKPLTAYVDMGGMSAVSKSYIYNGSIFIFALNVGMISGTVQWSASGVTITVNQ